jgi:hypothetical protein
LLEKSRDTVNSVREDVFLDAVATESLVKFQERFFRGQKRISILFDDINYPAKIHISACGIALIWATPKMVRVIAMTSMHVFSLPRTNRKRLLC